ncbi:hypothetical protein JB92DRAFT_2873046 [Gautieria morchelliformis]|nr:hypothetical protein JB92DRAFT_2873046 [Gautieria morchelliformis]
MAKDEVEIDAAQERIRQIWKCMMMRVRGLWENVATMAGGAGVRYQPQAPEPAGPTQLAYTLWQTYGPDLTALLYAPHPPYPYAQPPSQPQPHDSRARGTTPASDMHPGAAELSPLPPTNPHGEAPSARSRAASSTYLLAPGDERRRVDEGEGAGDDRGGARASSGSWITGGNGRVKTE